MLVALATGCGDDGSADNPPSAGGDPSTATSTAAPGTTTAGPRSAPRWETVATFSGTGPLETPQFTILPGAIQWRVRWNCESGELAIHTVPPPRKAGPLVTSACPKNGDGYSIATGAVHLAISASGPWKAIVDQQIDTPLDEAPPAGVHTAEVVGEGAFYDVEKTGKGTARLYRMSDGRRVLRFEGFEVTNNTDLFVWLTDSAQPKTSAEAVSARRVVLGNLKSTLGNQNYDVPSDLAPDRIRSVVIWCDPIAIAYSASSLGG